MSADQLFPTMPVPPVTVRRTTNWTPTILAVALGVIVAVVAVVALHGRGVELAKAQASLHAAQATITTQSNKLASTQSDLASTKTSLSAAQSHLSSARSALSVALRCASATLHSWYSTIYLSYSLTGVALQRAVNSRACKAVRAVQVHAGNLT